MTDDKHLLIKIPANLKKQLQIIAIQKDTTMTEITLQLIEQYVQEQKNIKTTSTQNTK